MSEPIQIPIVDDHTLFRDGLRAVFSSRPETTVVGEAGAGQRAVAPAEELQPDVVLMDIQMPQLNGIETSPHIGVIMVTMFEDDESVFAAMRAGREPTRRGYLLKRADQAEMVRTIRAVARGKALFSPTLARKPATFFANIRPDAPQGVFPELTEREQEVLALIGQGTTTKLRTALCSARRRCAIMSPISSASCKWPTVRHWPYWRGPKGGSGLAS